VSIKVLNEVINDIRSNRINKRDTKSIETKLHNLQTLVDELKLCIKEVRKSR